MINIPQLSVNSIFTGNAVPLRYTCAVSSLAGISILRLIPGTVIDGLTLVAGYRVLLTGNVNFQQTFTVAPVADVAASLNGKYWQFNTKAGSAYYVWYFVTGQPVLNPNIVGRTGIQVTISINATATAVTSATATSLNPLVPSQLASISNSGTVLTIVDAAIGDVPFPTANTSGFTVVTTFDGVTLADRGIWITGNPPIRAPDCDLGTKLSGALIYIHSGLYHGNTMWQCTNSTSDDVVGSFILTFYNQTDVVTFVRDQKSIGTNGGSAAAGISTRALNGLRDSWGGTEVTPSVGGITLDIANSAILMQPGRYVIWVTAPAYRVDAHQIALETGPNTTTWTRYISYGTSELAPNATNSLVSKSSIMVFFNVTDVAALRVRHYCQTARANDGFGVATGNTFPFSAELYTDMFIIKYGSFRQ